MEVLGAMDIYHSQSVHKSYDRPLCYLRKMSRRTRAPATCKVAPSLRRARIQVIAHDKNWTPVKSTVEATEWVNYESKIYYPEATESAIFATQLLLRTDPVALKEVAQFGDDVMKQAAWRTLAAQGVPDDLAALATMRGAVPPLWMEDSYQLYEPDLVRAMVVYNGLSRFDAPDVSYYIERDFRVFKSRPTLQQWLESDRPLLPNLPRTDNESEAIHTMNDLVDVEIEIPCGVQDPTMYVLARYAPHLIKDTNIETVLAGCLVVEEGIVFTVRTTISSYVEDTLANVYRIDPEVVRSLNDVLCMKLLNSAPTPFYFNNVTWIAHYAPWLILTSTKDISLPLFGYFRSYEIQLRYGTEKNSEWLVARCEPTRQSLASYYSKK